MALERKLDPELPLLRLDGPQIKRVIINLVEDHGGEIRVEDNLPRGARFVIELPA